jgi:type I restriction enzyme R subunit
MNSPFMMPLAQNQSARDVMGQDQLRELAIVLVSRVRKTASIDWNLKESVRARMKVMVKRYCGNMAIPRYAGTRDRASAGAGEGLYGV